MREHQLVSSQQPLLVAVSGGADSVCLLHVLLKLQEELKVKLYVAHLDHQLRGAESEVDADYVSALAHQLGLPVTIQQRDVKAYQAQKHDSLEEAAREVRYNFLADVARSLGTDRVAVGHTLDDHIETVLMHLIRGTGTRGLRGLQPVSRWQSSGSNLIIIRPLLEVSRQETAAYCQYYQLKPRLDTSNLSLSPFRNRIRLQLLPLLQSYNPRVVEALLRTARLAEDELAFLDGETTRLWDSIAQRRDKIIILDKGGFLNLPSALKGHLLRVSIEKLLGSLKDVEARHIEEIMAALTKPAGKRLSLPGGLVFTVEYDRYLLTLDAAVLSPLPLIHGEFVLKIPGATVLPGWQVMATILNKGGFNYSLDTAFPFRQVKEETAKRSFIAYLNLDKVGGKAFVRGYQPGDRFQPLGMRQPKKLAEFMVDAKIPRAWRKGVPIVCSPHHILWVVGWRLDERVKVTENTEQILRLEFERVSNSSNEG